MSVGVEEERVNSEIQDDHDTVKEDIYQLIQQAATSEGLINMRVNMNQSKVFDIFHPLQYWDRLESHYSPFPLLHQNSIVTFFRR